MAGVGSFVSRRIQAVIILKYIEGARKSGSGRESRVKTLDTGEFPTEKSADQYRLLLEI
jgi:hypothetical protein